MVGILNQFIHYLFDGLDIKGQEKKCKNFLFYIKEVQVFDSIHTAVDPFLKVNNCLLTNKAQAKVIVVISYLVCGFCKTFVDVCTILKLAKVKDG